MQRANRLAFKIARRGILRLQCRFTPLARAGTESPLEAGVEKSQMIKTTLLGDVDDLGVGIPQQRHRFKQARFHSQGRHGNTKMLVKQTVQVAAAATESGGQLTHGKVDEFGRRQLLKNLHHVIFRAHIAAALGLSGFKFQRQNARGNPQQLAAVIQIKIGRNCGQQTLAIHRQWIHGRVSFGGLETFDDVVQLADLIAGKQGQQIFKAYGKSPENEFSLAVGRSEFATGNSIKNQNIRGDKPLGGCLRGVFADTAFGKHKNQSFPFLINFLKGL